FPGVVFDPDGTSFAASADPFGVSIWDSRTGQHRMTLTDGNARFTSIDYDPGGRILVASSDLSAPRVWDVTSGDLLLELGGPDGVVARTVAFSPDGQTIAAGS